MKVKIRHLELEKEKQARGYFICIVIVVGLTTLAALLWPAIKAAQQYPSLWHDDYMFTLWARKTGYYGYLVIVLLSFLIVLVGLLALDELWLNKKVVQMSTRKIRRYYVRGVVVARSITGDTTGLYSTTERHYELSVELDNAGRQIIEVVGLEHYRATKAEGDRVAIEVEEKISKKGRVLERNFLQTKKLKTTPAAAEEAGAGDNP